MLVPVMFNVILAPGLNNEKMVVLRVFLYCSYTVRILNFCYCYCFCCDGFMFVSKRLGISEYG